MGQESTSITKHSFNWRVLAIGFVLGSFSLCTVSVFQKLIAGYNIWTPKGYIIPTLYGGLAGAIIAYYFDKVQSLNRNLTERLIFLESLFPICSYCKKIRDKKGAWNQLESYFTRNAGTLFSHSICDDCLDKAYLDLGLEKQTREQLSKDVNMQSEIHSP